MHYIVSLKWIGDLRYIVFLLCKGKMKYYIYLFYEHSQVWLISVSKCWKYYSCTTLSIWCNLRSLAAGIFTIIYRNYLRFFLWLVFNVISFWNFKYLNLVWKGYTWCAPSRRHYGIRCFWRRSLRCCWQQHYTISRYWRGKRNS